MKTIDERELQKKKQQEKNKQRQKEASALETIMKLWELNDFVVHLI